MPGHAQHFPVDAPDVMDLAGAGDTALAVVAASLATRFALPVAARLATAAAGIVLRRIGTAVVRPADLIAALSPHAAAMRKIVPRETLAERGERWRRRGLKCGLVMGSFDPLRAGHMHLLEQARAVCDRLVVAVYDDASVQRRRGPDRPLQPEAVRAARLAGVGSVDLVVVSSDRDGGDVIAALRPDVLAGASALNLADQVRAYGGVVLLSEPPPDAAAAAPPTAR